MYLISLEGDHSYALDESSISARREPRTGLKYCTQLSVFQILLRSVLAFDHNNPFMVVQHLLYHFVQLYNLTAANTITKIVNLLLITVQSCFNYSVLSI